MFTFFFHKKIKSIQIGWYILLFLLKRLICTYFRSTYIYRIFSSIFIESKTNDVQSYFLCVHFLRGAFFYCLLLLFSSLARPMVLRLFETFIWLSVSVCLFNYSGILTFTTETYQTSYLFTVSSSFCSASPEIPIGRIFVFLVEENYTFDHLPRSTIMNAICIELYIHYVQCTHLRAVYWLKTLQFIAFIFKPCNQQ